MSARAPGNASKDLLAPRKPAGVRGDRLEVPGEHRSGPETTSDERTRFLALLREFGCDAVSFQGLKSGFRYWFDSPSPVGTGGGVAYVDTGAAWVAAGGPVAPEDLIVSAAERFDAAARRAGRRTSFFAIERQLAGFDAIRIGDQALFSPARWLAACSRLHNLLAQIRRALAKGVRLRRVAAEELRAGAPLRTQIEGIACSWLQSRAMEPMGHIVAVEPFGFAGEHRYYLAELEGRAVAFLSAIPVYARGGWLIEDVLRDGAPNGTTEALFLALMKDVQPAATISFGLAPLRGRVAAWLRVARLLGRPLFDFEGLQTFKERLHPTRWEPVWLAFPRGERGARHVIDALRAFASGSLLRFGGRSILRRPAAPPLALAIVLAASSLVLGLLALLDLSSLLGLPRTTLLALASLYALLTPVLFRFARKPGPTSLVATLLAAAYAAFPLAHRLNPRPPAATWRAALGLAATVGPVLAVLALAWATVLRLRRGRATRPDRELDTGP
jgi:phosphatidylglycerol lysyltransferase